MDEANNNVNFTNNVENMLKLFSDVFLRSFNSKIVKIERSLSKGLSEGIYLSEADLSLSLSRKDLWYFHFHNNNNNNNSTFTPNQPCVIRSANNRNICWAVNKNNNNNNIQTIEINDTTKEEAEEFLVFLSEGKLSFRHVKTNKWVQINIDKKQLVLADSYSELCYFQLGVKVGIFRISPPVKVRVYVRTGLRGKVKVMPLIPMHMETYLMIFSVDCNYFIVNSTKKYLQLSGDKLKLGGSEGGSPFRLLPSPHPFNRDLQFFKLFVGVNTNDKLEYFEIEESRHNLCKKNGRDYDDSSPPSLFSFATLPFDNKKSFLLNEEFLVDGEEVGLDKSSKLFGIEIDDLDLTSVKIRNVEYKIPLFIKEGVEYLEKSAMDVEGLFRISGSKSRLVIIKSHLDEGYSLLDSIQLEEGNINISENEVASLIKLFLSSLPNPLFPYDLYDDFLQVPSLFDPSQAILLPSSLHKEKNKNNNNNNNDNNHNNKNNNIAYSIPQREKYKSMLNRKMGRRNRDLLYYLFHFLVKVAENAEKNKMTVENLSIVFAPNLLRPRGVNTFNPTTLLVIQTFLLDFSSLFSFFNASATF